MAHSSPLTGEYLRVFERHATKNDPKRGGAMVPCWEIVAYAADILNIAARELGENRAYDAALSGVLGWFGIDLRLLSYMIKALEDHAYSLADNFGILGLHGEDFDETFVFHGINTSCQLLCQNSEHLLPVSVHRGIIYKRGIR